jgi:hypothetical protein
MNQEMPTPNTDYADPAYSKAYAEGAKAGGSEPNPYKPAGARQRGWSDGRYDSWSRKVTDISRVSVFYAGSVYLEPTVANA